MVSIVSTVFNGSKYVDNIVASIISQTHTDFEWIVVDDGSTDDTVEKLLKYSENEPRIKVLQPGKLGRTKALNYAIESSGYELIFQQDFDDISYPDRIERQLLEFQDEKIGLVGSNYYLVNLIRGERFARNNAVRHSKILYEMSKCVPICHTLAAFRKSAWKDVNGYDENFNDIIDLRFYIAVASQGWLLTNTQEILGEHYVYADSNYIKANKYSVRQKNLRALNLLAIKTFNLPTHCYLYVLGRTIYYKLLNKVKSLLRKVL